MLEIDDRLDVQCARDSLVTYSDLHSVLKSNHKRYRFIISLYRKGDSELTYRSFLFVQQCTVLDKSLRPPLTLLNLLMK